MFKTGPGVDPVKDGLLFDFTNSTASSPRPHSQPRPHPDQPLQPMLPPRLNCESAFSSKGYTLRSVPMLRSPNWCRRMDISVEEQPIITPPSPEMSAIAFASLQLLPVPMMVLSSEKKVVFANEALGVLLGLPQQRNSLAGRTPQSASDILRGKTIFEVGVEIHDESSPEWEDWRWDTLLDDVTKEMQVTSEWMGSVHRDGHEDWYGNRESRSIPWRLSLDPRGGAVDVTFRTQNIHPHTITGDTRMQIAAQMSVTVWTLKTETYFTVTFTSITHRLRSSSAKDTLSTEASRATSPAETPAHSPTDTLATSSCQDCGSETFESESSKSRGCTSSWVPSAETLQVRSLLQHKIAKLKDALIDLMELPVFIMWIDGSLAFPNRAALDLIKIASKTCLPVGHALDILNCFTLYTADFSRALTIDEHPVTRICKARENFSSQKVGLIDILGTKKLFDVGGKGIIDDESGEFLAGMCWARDVTEFQEKLDAQKAADELRFMTICNVMPQLIWTTTPTGYVDWWSERWYDFTGLSPNESLGLGWEQSIHPHDLGETLEKWRVSLSTGKAYGIEYRVKRWDGMYRWMLARGLPLRDPSNGQILKWFGTCTDIDELVQARLDAKQTREQLTNVMAHAALSLWTVNRDFKISMAEGDHIWARTAGILPSVFVGKSIFEIVSREEYPEFFEPLEGILNGDITEEMNAEYYMNGRCLRTTYVPIRGQDNSSGKFEENQITGVIGVCVDITDKVNTLHELAEREKENQILMANERAANEASKLKSLFLASMSHEIRTPIAGVLGMADLLIDTQLSTEQVEFVTSIQSSATALLTVINDILDFSKVESGKMEIDHVQFNLFHVIGDVLKMLAFEAEKKKLDMKHDIELESGLDPITALQNGIDSGELSPRNQCCVMGDPGRLRQVLTNLISNSIKFTQDGSVRLSLNVEHEDTDSVTVKFVVKDTGIGIEEKKLARLFHPFTQADSSTARRFGGTGLGLSISKNLVELMGGNIGLASKVGEGTTAWFSIPFEKPGYASSRSASISSADAPPDIMDGCLWEFDRYQQSRPPLLRSSGTAFTFPLSQDECRLNAISECQLHQFASALKAPTPPTPPPVPTISPNDRKTINILVVEDNEINQQIALRVIEKLGFGVSAVSNGVEAIQYLHSCTEHQDAKRPDIVLMDVHMPEMDGYQATQIIRSGDFASAGLGLKGRTDPSIKQWLKGLPIIALTASAIRGDSDKCLEAGMDDYLAKPVKRQDLERMILKWLSDQMRDDAAGGTDPVAFGSPATDTTITNGGFVNGRAGGESPGSKKSIGKSQKHRRQRAFKVQQRITPGRSITTTALTHFYIQHGPKSKEGGEGDEDSGPSKEGNRTADGNGRMTSKTSASHTPRCALHIS